MIVKKIKKHLLIFQRRINKNKELINISKYNNEFLHKILEAYLIVQHSKFTDEDKSIFKKAEDHRQQLLNIETIVSYKPLGFDQQELVKDICRKGASGEKWCQFLYFITKKIDTPVFLEMGTNVGMSGTYILEALKDKPESKFITMEGLPQLCAISSKQFSSIVPEEKYEIKQGIYDLTFPMLLKENIPFNIFFIDGNHQKNPTIDYFSQLKSKVVSQAIFIFDDINWSAGMKEAWNIIRNDHDVNYSIDLYRQGIIIIDKNDSRKNVDFKLHLAY